MRKIILCLSLIFALQPAFAADVQNGFQQVASQCPYGGMHNHIGHNNWGYRNHRFNRYNRFNPYNGFNRFNPYNRFFNRFNRGTLTGFSPPVTSGNTWGVINDPYSTTYYSNTPFYNTNTGVMAKIKNFFNPNYNVQNGFSNGTYDPTSGSYTPLFDNSSTPNSGGAYNNGWGYDGGQNSHSGMRVKIID